MVAPAIVRQINRVSGRRCTNRRRLRLLGTFDRGVHAVVGSRRLVQGGAVGMSEVTVAGGTFRCCPGCARREAAVVQRFIERGLSSLPVGTHVAFLTITEPSKFRSVQEHAEAVSAFLEDIWNMFRGVRPYTAVREFQERGAIHTHALIVDWQWVHIPKLQRMANRRGLGAISLRGSFRVGAEVQEVNGKPQRINNLGAYMAKTFGNYMSKSIDKWQQYVDLMPKGYRQLHHGGGWPGTLTGLREEIASQTPRARRRLARSERQLEYWRATDLLGDMLNAVEVPWLSTVPGIVPLRTPVRSDEYAY